MTKITEAVIGRLRFGQELRDPTLPGFGIRKNGRGATWSTPTSHPGRDGGAG